MVKNKGLQQKQNKKKNLNRACSDPLNGSSDVPKSNNNGSGGKLMVRYLIKRQNRFGYWVHIDTIQALPFLATWDNYLRRYGPGRYMILVAQEGQPGLKVLEDQPYLITVPARFEIPDPSNNFWAHEPTWEELVQTYGAGDYVVAKLSDLKSLILERGTNIDNNILQEIVNEATDSIRGGFIVFRLFDIPK